MSGKDLHSLLQAFGFLAILVNDRVGWWIRLTSQKKPDFVMEMYLFTPTKTKCYRVFVWPDGIVKYNEKLAGRCEGLLVCCCSFPDREDT